MPSTANQSSQPLLAWLAALAAGQHALCCRRAARHPARRVFERSLIASAGHCDTEHATSVGYNLRARARPATVRERLSQEQWNVIVRAENEFFRQCALPPAADGDWSPSEVCCCLRRQRPPAAITGAQTDRMTRDDGWRLLSIGRWSSAWLLSNGDWRRL